MDIRIERGKIKLKTLARIQKAQKTGEWDDLIPVVAELAHISVDEAGELTIDQFEAITTAIQESTSIPNVSAPPIEQP